MGSGGEVCVFPTAMSGTAAPKVPGYVATGDIKALLLHHGHNMWCDWFPEDMDLAPVKAEF